jgi:Uncharacterised protein family (UPF0158)
MGQNKAVSVSAAGIGGRERGLTEGKIRACNLLERLMTSRCPEVFAAMATSVSLDELIDALEEQSDSLLPYLNRETGEVLLISEESLSLGEAGPEEIELLPDWQKEEAELAVLIETTDQYLALPDRLEVNEWNIMQEFCLEVKRDNIRAALLGAIRGVHPFRRFKEQIGNHALWEEWNRFRRQAFGEIMREWCEENGISIAVRQKQSARP